MQIDHLKEFVVFSQYMNFTKASRVLHMSQSNLSKHIHQLEAELRFPLIMRSGTKTHITKEGDMFLGNIVTIMDSLDSLIEKCRVSSKAVNGKVIEREGIW